MNNETPASTAALQARIADLEQQLKLSDEGVSRLAERCLGPTLRPIPRTRSTPTPPLCCSPPSISMRASAFRRKTPSPPRTMRWTS